MSIKANPRLLHWSAGEKCLALGGRVFDAFDCPRSEKLSTLGGKRGKKKTK